MNIIKYYSVNNDCYRNNVNKADSRYIAFQRNGPQGLMLHSVGVSQPSAEVFAKQWNRSGYEVAVHAVLQADGTVYQCLPWNYRGWHCGGSANNTHIGVEMTEPSQIRYAGGASFTVTDKAAAQAQAKGTYETAVALFAQLCKTYGLDPETSIISHSEGYKKGVASGHSDPEHLWRGLGLSYTMDTFRAAVKAAMNPVKAGWVQDGNGWWYRLSDGSYPKECWRQIDGAWYYFDSEGYMVQDKTVEYDGKVYTFDSSGHVTAKAAEQPQKEEDDMLTYEQFKEYMTRYEAERAAQPPSDWSKEDRAWAEEKGIIRGDEKGNMMYGAYVTREQMAAMLHRLEQSHG